MPARARDEQARDGAVRDGRAGDTRSRILDVSERLVQIRGFNGFSYADVAAELGIKKASLHYHFPSKSDLGEAIIARYARRFTDALAAIDAEHESAPAKLAAYADLYAQVLRERRMCLCGMLAAEYETVPGPIQSAVVEFLDGNERWLEGVLESGRASGSLAFSGPAAVTARSVVSGLEGAMLIARPYGAVDRFEAVAAQLLAGLAGTARAARRFSDEPDEAASMAREIRRGEPQTPRLLDDVADAITHHPEHAAALTALLRALSTNAED